MPDGAHPLLLKRRQSKVAAAIRVRVGHAVRPHAGGVLDACRVGIGGRIHSSRRCSHPYRCDRKERTGEPTARAARPPDGYSGLPAMAHGVVVAHGLDHLSDKYGFPRMSFPARRALGCVLADNGNLFRSRSY